MEKVSSLDPLRHQVKQWRQAGLTIAFVPTMGNLHAGHLSLVAKAQQSADKVIVSIFVNPLQFNSSADLAAYPHTLDSDIRQLKQMDCDLVFTPDVSTIYPDGMGKQTRITVPEIGDRLCGAHRLGHFDGVATVVAKLFNMVIPDIAIFGQKDFQQLLLIKKLVRDLALPIEIVGAPTHREENGLAMSSRNQYLARHEQAIAAAIYQALLRLKQQLKDQQRSYTALCEQAKQSLEQKGFEVDYIEICRETDLMPAQLGDSAVRILIAAQLGSARLIDNLACDLD